MAIRNLPLSSLAINRANDRHGELENETAAIAWLFKEREQHMRNLAKDIVDRGEMYEFPLVSPDKDKFIVFDGNRRLTCLKLLDDPRRAPTVELQAFFREQRARWNSHSQIASSARLKLIGTGLTRSFTAGTPVLRTVLARARGTTE